MGLLDWLLCVGYLILVLGQGLWFARGQKTNEEYFLGGRRMNWLVVGVSLFSITISPLSFVGLPREAAYQDYHLFLAILFIPLFATPVVAIWFVPLYHRLRLTSAYEYLELRFNRRIRQAGSLFYCLYTIGWMGTILYATALIVQASLDLTPEQLPWVVVALGVFTTAYTTIGGYRGLVWTNTVQSLLLIGGILTVLVLALGRVEGGASAVWRLGWEHDKFQMFNVRFDLAVRGNFFTACAYGVFVYLAASAVTQTAVQRIVSMPSVAAARRSLVVRAVLVAGVCLVFFWLGSTLFAFYVQHPAANAAKGSSFPALHRQDQLTTYFVRTELPYPGLLGVLLVGLFAAAMSTVSSGLNSLAALAVTDWWPGQKLGVRLSRQLVATFGTVTVGTALLVPSLGEHVFDILITIAGAFFGPLLGLFLLGMLVRRANAGGAAIGVLAGVVSLCVLYQTNISPWWYGAFTCIPTVVVGGLGSLLFPPPAAIQVRGLLILGGEKSAP